MCYIPTLALCFTKHQYTSGKKYYLCSGTNAQWQPFWNLAAIVFNIISHNRFFGIYQHQQLQLLILRQPFTVSENLPDDQVRILYPLFCISISSNSWVGRCVWSNLISIMLQFCSTSIVRPFSHTSSATHSTFALVMLFSETVHIYRSLTNIFLLFFSFINPCLTKVFLVTFVIKGSLWPPPRICCKAPYAYAHG